MFSILVSDKKHLIFPKISDRQLAKWFGKEVYAELISIKDCEYFPIMAARRDFEVQFKDVKLKYVIDGKEVYNTIILNRVSYLDIKKL